MIDYRKEFPQAESLCYLNHAAVGPWPARTCAAIEAFAQDNVRYGASHYPKWEITAQALRAQLRRLINAASVDDIALLKNTSEALSVVAYGLDWQPGDNIVLPANEFPSNRIVWQSLQARFGVEARLIALDTAEPEAQLLAAVDRHTRLISCSSVQYDSGRAMDIARLGNFCKQQGILFCIDAIQSLGVIPFNLQHCQVDFVMADGHKWLLAPEGLALFYCRPERREQLHLQQYGWRMVETPEDFQNLAWEPAASARRFECGSPNHLGIIGMHASLSLFEDIGASFIHNEVIKNTLYLFEKLEEIPDIQIHTPRRQGRYAGIVNFSHRHIPNEVLYRRLLGENIICALRGPGIRWSAHFYQAQEQLQIAIDKLRLMIKIPPVSKECGI